jgi:hypothetical protein
MPSRPSKRRKLRRDFSQRALATVSMATREVLLEIDQDEAKDTAASARGRLGGRKGGKAGAKNLSAAKRKAIANRRSWQRRETLSLACASG